MKDVTTVKVTDCETAAANQTCSGVKYLVFTVLALWFGLVVFLASQGAFVGREEAPPLPIFFGFAVPLAVFFVAYAGWQPFRKYVLAADLRLVAGIQAWRWGGLGFLALYAYGILPGLFAIPAALGDMAIGFSAPWIVLGLIRDRTFVAGRRYLLWNILGILDLVVAVSLGTICSGFIPGLTGTVTTSAMAQLPLVLIPAYFVPLFIVLHVTGMAQARRFKRVHAPETARAPLNHVAGTSTDSPGVIVFPPALLLGTLLLGLLINIAWPWHFTSAAWMKAVGVALFLGGVALTVWGRNTMARAGTHVPPHKPTLVIVTDGPFRLTRNPLYLGGTIAFIGLSLGTNLIWGLILLIPMLLILNWGIVKREERYLERKFGETYLAYKARVPRWIYGLP